MESGPSVEFRPLTRDDLALLHRWLNEPHVVATYGLGRGRTLAEVAEKYGPLAGGSDRTRPFVILVGGKPAGYVQTYRILDHPEYAREVGVADESHGLDLFLGEPDLVGRGLGPRVIRTFATTRIFAVTDAVAVVCDPPSSNRRSVRALEKAGFVLWRTIVPPSPECGDLLMRLERGGCR